MITTIGKGKVLLRGTDTNQHTFYNGVENATIMVTEGKHRGSAGDGWTSATMFTGKTITGYVVRTTNESSTR